MTPSVRLLRAHRPMLPLAAVALAALPLHAGGADGITTRESFAHDGAEAVEHCLRPSISGDGRWLVFDTTDALVPEDTNGDRDVYALDRWNGDLVGVSVNLGGTWGNADSSNGVISRDGRFVAFQSFSNNLVPFDFNVTEDVFLKNLTTGLLTRVSSPIGGVVAAAGTSNEPSISSDGTRIAFQSSAPNFVPGDANGTWDVYVRDTNANTIVRASLDAFGGDTDGPSYAPSISGDGTRVSFHSNATDIRLLDGNGTTDVFVRLLDAGVTWLASKPMIGVVPNAMSFSSALSSDGDRVVFVSSATDLVPADTNGLDDVFVHHLDTGEVELLSISQDGDAADGESYHPTISRDGRFVAFTSAASNLTPEDSPFYDVFVRHIDEGETWLVSRRSGLGNLSDGDSVSPALADGATIVAFQSAATNLDQADTNGTIDVFTRTIFPDPFTYCEGTTTNAGCEPRMGSTGRPSASADSGFTVRASQLPNQKSGIIFYGVNGAAEIPFQGGTLCVAGPRKRTPLQGSGGTAAPAADCSGNYVLDMNAFAAGLAGGNPDPALSQVGQQVNVQAWGRDPLGATTTFLSDALEYVVGL